MDILDSVGTWVLPFLAVFTVLVFVHELGHYWVARRCGVRVETFSIGFGPELYGWNDGHGTRWRFSAIPLGGYVKMFGENDFAGDDETALTPEERAVSFHHKPLRHRAAIVAAGPLANFAFAIAVLALLFGAIGVPTPMAVVGQVQAGSAAEAADMRSGDVVRAIDGVDLASFEDLRRLIIDRGDKTIRIDVDRDGELVSLTATPRLTEIKDEGGGPKTVGLLGVSPDPTRVTYDRLDPFSAAWTATERTVSLTAQILSALGQIIAGTRTAEELGGPLRIAQLSGEMAQSGLVNLIFFMAALSVNLGLINLFPVPMLDGGHLVFYAAEAVRGRPLDRRLQEYGFRFGLVLVLALMIFATWNDLVQMRVWELF